MGMLVQPRRPSGAEEAPTTKKRDGVQERGPEGFGLIRGGRGRDFWLIDFKSESGWGVEVD